MAMNKSEKAKFDRLQIERDMARSLRWPHYPKPEPITKAEIDVETKGHFNSVMRGWFHNSYEEARVTYGCSNGINHNRDGDKTNAQTMGVMFRWKSDALKMMRHEMTEKYAKELADIDRRIDEALAEEGGSL